MWFESNEFFPVVRRYPFGIACSPLAAAAGTGFLHRRCRRSLVRPPWRGAARALSPHPRRSHTTSASQQVAVALVQTHVAAAPQQGPAAVAAATAAADSVWVLLRGRPRHLCSSRMLAAA